MLCPEIIGFQHADKIATDINNFVSLQKQSIEFSTTEQSASRSVNEAKAGKKHLDG
jgi:hypothetical protein